jgi:hypothetical protein
VARRPKAARTETELENRRLALESALGSLHIEGMELEWEGREILDRFARGGKSLCRKCGMPSAPTQPPWGPSSNWTENRGKPWRSLFLSVPMPCLPGFDDFQPVLP